MKLPKGIYLKKQHGDVKRISELYDKPTSTISDVFQIGEGNPKVVRSIIEYYSDKPNKID